jgi:hypothetical protein
LLPDGSPSIAPDNPCVLKVRKLVRRMTKTIMPQTVLFNFSLSLDH